MSRASPARPPTATSPRRRSCWPPRSPRPWRRRCSPTPRRKTWEPGSTRSSRRSSRPSNAPNPSSAPCSGCRSAPTSTSCPLRQGRAIGWLSEALEPLRAEAGDEAVHRLAVALRSVCGIETRVWLGDIAPGRDDIRELQLWMAQACWRVPRGAAAAVGLGHLGWTTGVTSPSSSRSPCEGREVLRTENPDVLAAVEGRSAGHERRRHRTPSSGSHVRPGTVDRVPVVEGAAACRQRAGRRHPRRVRVRGEERTQVGAEVDRGGEPKQVAPGDEVQQPFCSVESSRATQMVHACGEEKPHQGMSRWYCVGAPYGSLIRPGRGTGGPRRGLPARRPDCRSSGRGPARRARLVRRRCIRCVKAFSLFLPVSSGWLPATAASTIPRHSSSSSGLRKSGTVRNPLVRYWVISSWEKLLRMLLRSVCADPQAVGASGFEPSVLHLSTCEILLSC